MVQHTVSSKTADRGIAPRSRKRIEEQRPLETGVGCGRRVGPRREKPRVVCEERGPAAAARAVVAGFFFLVARLFQRRFPSRPCGHRKILERSENTGTPREARGSA